VEALVSIDEVHPSRLGKHPPSALPLEVVTMRQATSQIAVRHPSSVVTRCINDTTRGHDGLDRRLVSLVQPQPAVLRNEILRILGDKSLRGKMSRYSRSLAEAWFEGDRNFSTVESAYQGGPGGRSRPRSGEGHEYRGRAELRQ
jgi:hypothetical protein